MTLESRVKNTFIDIEDSDVERHIRRTKTAPARKVSFVESGNAEDSDLEDSDGTLSDEEQQIAATRRISTLSGSTTASCDLTPESSDPSNCMTCPTTPHTPHTPYLADRATLRMKTFDAFEQEESLARQEDVPSPRVQPSQVQAPAQVVTEVAAAPPVSVAPTTNTMPSAGAVVMVPGGPLYGPNFITGIAMAPATAVAVPMGYAMAPGAMAPGMIVPNQVQPVGRNMPQANGVATPDSAVLRHQTISQEFRDGVRQVKWIVDARKLKANDKAIISPPFEISDEYSGTFRIILNATQMKVRGGATFRNSGGKGSVQLKCESNSDKSIQFKVAIGDGPNGGRATAWRGPVQHNLAHGGVCGLSKGHEEWNFNLAVEESSKTFAVRIGFLSA